MSEITISQALRYSSKLKKQISDARIRAANSLNYKAGEETAFSFIEMLKKADSLSYELAKLHGKMAVANASNQVEYEPGEFITLSHAIRILEETKGRIAWVKALPCQMIESVSTIDQVWDDGQSKYLNKSTTTICSLPEAKRAELLDKLQDEYDALNGAVELVNQVVKITT